MPAGRPTKLTRGVVKAAEEYLDAQEDVIDEYDSEKGQHKEIVRVHLPTLKGLAVHLKVRRSTIYNWADGKLAEGQNFRYLERPLDIVDRLQATQAQRLIDNGLSGAYSAPISTYSQRQAWLRREEHDRAGQPGRYWAI